jgi:ABC-type uncharacterized transport system substrate-binding protein
MFRLPIAAVLASGVLMLGCVSAVAHPHVWITMRSDVIVTPDGKVTAIRQHWTFDDMFSAFALQGLEHTEQGKFTREELQPLAKVNVESLKEYEYFTLATADGKKVEMNEPTSDYWLDYADSVLTLNFTLPLKIPVKAKELKFDIYDPTIFIDFEFAKNDPAKLIGAPQCKMDVVYPREMTYAEGKALSNIPADQPNVTMAWGANFANKLLVHCP